MAQLVEVQQLRGAVGGDAFCYLLTEPPVKRESRCLLPAAQYRCLQKVSHFLGCCWSGKSVNHNSIFPLIRR